MNKLITILMLFTLLSCSKEEETCQTCTVITENSKAKTDLAAAGFVFADLFTITDEDIVGNVCGDELSSIKSRAMSQTVKSAGGLDAISRVRVICE